MGVWQPKTWLFLEGIKTRFSKLSWKGNAISHTIHMCVWVCVCIHTVWLCPRACGHRNPNRDGSRWQLFKSPNKNRDFSKQVDNWPTKTWNIKNGPWSCTWLGPHLILEQQFYLIGRSWGKSLWKRFGSRLGSGAPWFWAKMLDFVADQGCLIYRCESFFVLVATVAGGKSDLIHHLVHLD